MKNTVKRISILASAFLMAVTGCFSAASVSGAEKNVDVSSGYAAETINLSDAKTIAGNCVMVEMSLNTGNQCSAYNLDVEFDSSLTLKAVKGVTTWEVNGNVATIIGFTGEFFEDGETLATFIFETPENASEGAVYDIGVKNVSDLAGQQGTLIDDTNVPKARNSTVQVVEEQKKFTNHIVLKKSLGLRGDANENGAVDILDAIMIAKQLLGKEKMNADQAALADVNANGMVDIVDAVSISKYLLASDKSNAWDTILK